MSDLQSEIIDIEEPEEIDDNDVVYQINTFGTDFDVEGLVKRVDRGDIYRPPFQRNYVWTLPQASKFIESILLGLPIPGVFLYKDEVDQKLLIIDGLQRLTTLHSFFKMRFPNTDRVFKLRDVRPRFNGKTLEELEPEDQRRFFDTVIHAQIIQQASPTDDNSSVYHIFDRLNSNGTPLQPQEMRAAIYHGAFQELLVQLNENAIWRGIFGPVHKRSKDQELVLRFFALYYEWKNYQKPMKTFLNTFMNNNRHIESQIASEFTEIFYSTMERIVEALGEKPFRPVRGLNVAVFDAFTIAVASTPHASANNISDAYKHLMADQSFIDAYSDSTSDESSVNARITLSLEALNAAAGG